MRVEECHGSNARRFRSAKVEHCWVTRATLARMPHLYGDSTPFPYDVDYIDLSRNAVDCAVQLLSAQHAISSALERAEALNGALASLVARVRSVHSSVNGVLDPQLASDSVQLERVARRLIETVEATVNDELARIERQAADEVAHTHNIMARSADSAHRALESFLQRNDLPGTEMALAWSAAGEQDYAGQVRVQTPFGVAVVFSLAIPSDHLWARARRLSEIAPGLEVHFPQQSGWLSKRVELAPVKLDRLFLSGVNLDATSAEFRLRKSANAGTGYRILVDLRGDHQVHLQALGEDGSPEVDPPSPLDGEDSAQMFRLASRVIESMQVLVQMRRSMVSAELDGQPLVEPEWPRAVADRLIQNMAPVVTEIARRSGAPGELVLRRDVGGGRREEVYVTYAELSEKILVLPPDRRAAFEVLGLREPAASPQSGPRPTRSGPALVAQVAAAASVVPSIG